MNFASFDLFSARLTAAAPAERSFAIAVDIGGTKVALQAIDRQGAPLTPLVKQPVPFRQSATGRCADSEALIDLIAPYVAQCRALAGDANGPCLGLGLSVCGNIDPLTGMAVLVPNLQWRNLPFGAQVQRVLGLPVFAATDVRMALLAELLWGAARGRRDVAWATVGTGYGGYLFLNGQLHDGSHRFAGNFGHMTLDERRGDPCGCGRRGCFETFVSGPAIARAGQRLAVAETSPYLAACLAAHPDRPISTAEVFAAERAADPAARTLTDEVIRLIAINLGGLVNILDLEMIVLGGGVVQSCPDFIARLDQAIRAHLMTAEARRDLRICGETFPNSSLQGAAADVFLRSP